MQTPGTHISKWMRTLQAAGSFTCVCVRVNSFYSQLIYSQSDRRKRPVLIPANSFCPPACIANKEIINHAKRPPQIGSG